MPNDNEQLIAEMRKCASVLEQMANDESLSTKTASASASASTTRAEYMAGIMQGLGLED